MWNHLIGIYYHAEIRLHKILCCYLQDFLLIGMEWVGLSYLKIWIRLFLPDQSNLIRTPFYTVVVVSYVILLIRLDSFDMLE